MKIKNYIFNFKKETLKNKINEKPLKNTIKKINLGIELLMILNLTRFVII